MNTPLSHVKYRPCGFTLMEVVIVMAIVAILAMMVVPVIYGGTARTQVTESLALADVAKFGVKGCGTSGGPPCGVAGYYARMGALPASNEVAGLPDANKLIGNYVTSVEVSDGAINITFGNNSHAKITGKRLSIRPAVAEGTTGVPITTWLCGNQLVPKGMVAGGTNVTNVPLDAVPPLCR